MSVRVRPRPEAEFDAEQEIDLGRYAAAVAARWWLPPLGLLAGVVVGYLLAIGGPETYRAQALVYLGVPLAPSGGAQLQSLATNPAAVREIVTSESIVRRVARENGLRPRALRGGISIQAAAAGGVARANQPPLVRVSVTGEAPRRVAGAANDLARAVVDEVADYAQMKVAALRQQQRQLGVELEAIDRQVDAAEQALRGTGLSTTDRLIILTSLSQAQARRSVVQQERLERDQLISVAENVESSRVVEPAVARKTTARSRRNSVVVAGALGLLAGLAAALLWEPLADRFGRRPA